MLILLAGWDRNSIYVMNVGLVYWAAVRDSDIVRGHQQETLAVADMMLTDSVIIPGTGFPTGKIHRSVMDNLASRIGRVTYHVVLARYIVFTTDLDKVFCYSTTFPMPALDMREPIELTTFYTASAGDRFRVRDLQGAFTRFAISTYEGNVLTASHDLLDAFWNAADTESNRESQILPSPALIPPLQDNSIASLAFGDYHFLALRSNGTAATYGEEPERCGALGLGSDMPFASLRGVIQGTSAGGPHRLPEGEGRTIWFEPLMKTWLLDVWRQRLWMSEDNELGVLLTEGNEGARKAYANYFEAEGEKWEESVTKEDDMGAYFVLKVAAGGWSSAALVLVDEEKAEKARQAHIIHSFDDRRTPSPALSAQSDHSDEVIESPGEQLSNAICVMYEWIRKLGWKFLGLAARDKSREDESKRRAHEIRRDRNEYVWSRAPFPRLSLQDGEAIAEHMY